MGMKSRSRSDGQFPPTHENSQGWRGTPRQSLATPKRLGGNNIQHTTSGRIEFRPGPVSEPVNAPARPSSSRVDSFFSNGRTDAVPELPE